MPTLKDIKVIHPKILLYGIAGTGKTALALTLGSKLQIMDFDNGLMTGKTLKDEHYDTRMSVNAIQFLEPDPNKGTAFLKAKNHLYKVAEACAKGKYSFKSICVDSLTSLVDSAMRMVQGNSSHIGKNPQLQEYGLAFNEVENFLTILKSLPILVVVTAHQHNFEIDNKTMVQIALPGRKLPGKICGWFDEVWRMTIQNLPKDEIAFRIQTNGTASTLARSRFNIPDKQNAKVGLPVILKEAGYEYDGEEDVEGTIDKG